MNECGGHTVGHDIQRKDPRRHIAKCAQILEPSVYVTVADSHHAKIWQRP